MDRLKWLFVVGVLALVVSVVAAGPAVAAKGGNNDNAHACQQGGHENQFEAETGNPFKNAGDCASHGAKGGATSRLQIVTDTYPCGGAGTCWGTLSGSGLEPGGWVLLINGPEGPFILTSGSVPATGSVNQPLMLLCTDQQRGVFAEAGRIVSNTVNVPC